MVFIAITGRPGVGKSTIFFKILNKLRECGVRACGFYCPEVREGGKRIGFKIIEVDGEREGWLALSLDRAKAMGYPTSGKRIGRYIVIESEALDVALYSLNKCESSGVNIVAIDELGPMELSIPTLRKRLVDVLKRADNALLVIHRNLNDREILSVLSSKGVQTYVVTEYNRAHLHEEIFKKLSHLCKGPLV